jgi:hypothetical protein
VARAAIARDINPEERPVSRNDLPLRSGAAPAGGSRVERPAGLLWSSLTLLLTCLSRRSTIGKSRHRSIAASTPPV